MKKNNIFFTVALFFILSILFTPISFAQDESLPGSELRIEDAVICHDIQALEPVGSGDVFSSDFKKLICFSRVIGAKEDTEIKHNWYFGEKLLSSVTLHVGSISWRTYSSKTILPEYSGEWKVEILSQNGEILKQIYFIVE